MRVIKDLPGLCPDFEKAPPENDDIKKIVQATSFVARKGAAVKTKPAPAV